MNAYITDIFKKDKKPRKGLLPVEWVVVGYIVITSIVMALCHDRLTNPDAMIDLRMKAVATTLLLFLVYRMMPYRLINFVRVGVQMIMLAWWYPDTYEINRMLPNLDHIFAAWEQNIFGCQPSLLFSEYVPWSWFSELMDLGYASYYPMIVLTVLFFFLFRYSDKMGFQRASFIIMASFFVYYLVFISVPVTGPTFYFKAVGVENITQGIFPNVLDYFNTHQECLPSPGYADGFFYGLVEDAKAAGERPTAAFPSSHVGISTILLLLAWRSGCRRFFYILLPFFILMFFATVYIQAHYAIDVIAGLLSGVLIYLCLLLISRNMERR